MADMETARKVFERFDADGDGRITAAEYRGAMAAMGDPYVTESVAQSLINDADSDGDGRMSWEEFWAIQQR